MEIVAIYIDFYCWASQLLSRLANYKCNVEQAVDSTVLNDAEVYRKLCMSKCIATTITWIHIIKLIYRAGYTTSNDQFHFRHKFEMNHSQLHGLCTCQSATYIGLTVHYSISL